MRYLAVLVFGGCSLYFEPGQKTPEAVAPPDAGPAADALPQCQLYYCDDGVIYQLDPVPVNPDLLGCQAPDYSTAEAIGTCEYGCRYDNLYQGGDPCAPAPPAIHGCEASSACTTGQTQQCPAPMQCGVVVSTGQCSCDANGQWACTPACLDGLCSPAAVQQALVGIWTGTVTTPFSWLPSYTTTLTVAANGDWSATGHAFYYGGNGGTNGAKIYVQAQTALGAYGIVRLFNASIDGQFTAMRVEPNRLRFTFVDSWLGCGRSFQFDLHRSN